MIAETFNITKTLAHEIVCSLFQIVTDSITSDRRIEIRNFGIFSKKTLKERDGRNPQNGNPIKIKQKSTIKFKSTIEL